MTAPCDLRFDCGRICLDLVATAGGVPAERLTGPEQLAAWLAGAGLVPHGTPLDGLDGRWVPRFRALRDLLHRVVHDELDGRAADEDLARLNSAARSGRPPAPGAVRGADGALARVLSEPPDCAGLLAAVARDAVALLTDPVARGLLRQCAAGNCSLVYLDTSRGRRRRWCSSEVCGNRERVARHRRRIVREGADEGADERADGGHPAPAPDAPASAPSSPPVAVPSAPAPVPPAPAVRASAPAGPTSAPTASASTPASAQAAPAPAPAGPTSAPANSAPGKNISAGS